MQPSDRTQRERAKEDDEKLVPLANVGGAAPTPLGLDSGGNLPGPEDDLANLEPEPPEAPGWGGDGANRRGRGPEANGQRRSRSPPPGRRCS